MGLLTTAEDVSAVADEIARCGPRDHIAIDTETTGLLLDTGDEIRGISYQLPSGSSGYLPISHPDHALDPAPVVRALADSSARHLFWNWPFDAVATGQVGLAPQFGKTDDAILASWLEDENVSHRLKDQGALWFDSDAKAEQTALKKLMAGRKKAEVYKELRDDGWAVVDAKDEASLIVAASKRTWATFTAEEIAAYAEADAVLTRRLWDRVRARRYELDPWIDYPRRLRIQETVFRMTRLGVAVDLEMVERQRAGNLVRMAEIEPLYEGVNLRSFKQLGRLIYETWGMTVRNRTKSGNPATDRDTLLELAEAHEGIAAILEYRKLSKAVGTYYDAMLAKADTQGRVHTSLNVIGTVTGRMSSSGPNLQNIPRDDTDPEVKRVFIASPGYELAEYDLVSAELYVGASISHDDDMLSALDEPGRDFHTETAMRMFGSADGTRRVWAKNANYGAPYGIGPKKFALYLVKGTGLPVTDSTVRRAKTMLNAHRQAWPMTYRAMRKLEQFAEKHHYLPLAQAGRWRHFRSPGIWVPSYHAFNSAVQGGVAEVVYNVMTEAEPALVPIGARMCLQVHDSLWLEQPPGSSAVIVQILQDILDAVSPYRGLRWDHKIRSTAR